MTKSEKFIKAHEMTRKLVSEYTNINYRTQFGICLKELNKVKKSASDTIEEIFNHDIKSWANFEAERIFSKKWKNKRIYITIRFGNGRHEVQCYKNLDDNCFYVSNYSKPAVKKAMGNICKALEIYTNEELENI